MSEIRRQHPLTDFLAKQGDGRVADAGVRVNVEPFLTYVNVRGRPDDPEFVAAIARVSGELPGVNRVSRNKHSVYWLGPEEFLVVAGESESRVLVEALREELRPTHAAATDLSGGQVMLSVSGLATFDLLSKAATLDFHHSAFRVGDCAQSTFAKSAALYALRNDAPTVELIVRRSFADYVGEWLAYAGQEFGIVFEQRPG